ncbi:MAG: sigma-70 family RNA polymerase sigma factor [Chloroflexota bacterium]|nr:sigma-70 family RNA polymerase sigma factor [Chloroflexota bacterium]
MIRNKVGGENQATVTLTDGESEICRLVDRAATGDFEAFGELYSLYLDRIYRYVFYQVKDRMTAEDVTEEVFVKAWQAIDSCKGKGQTFSPWLYRIAHNQVIDNIRGQRKTVSTDVDIAGDDDPELETEGKLERERLLAAISGLSQSQQQVIMLKFIEGMHTRQIGQIMGKSQGAVRILQMRALARLRQKLDKGK